MQEFYAANDLHPALDQVFPLSQVNDAFARMDAAAQFGKIVISIPTE